MTQMNNPLHVVHIASGDLWAGAEVQLFTLAKTLQRDTATTVSVVLLNHGRLENELVGVGIPVTVLDETELNGLQIFTRLVRVIKELKPDVVHTHRMKENILGSVAAWMAGRSPSIRTVHGAPEHAAPWSRPHKRLVQELDQLCGRMLQQRIVAVSNPLAELLRRSFPSDHVAVIENGIDHVTLDGLRAQRAQRRDVPQQPWRVALVGRLVPVKRVDLFLEMARLFGARYPHPAATFHIFGDGPLRGELEQLRDQLGLADVVQFEGHCDDLPARLVDIDVLVMTSDHEGLPMVVLEAMALGVPVVAHAVGGIPELLDGGHCGALVTEHTPAGYCIAAQELLARGDESQQSINNAHARVIDTYSATASARGYARCYREINTEQQTVSELGKIGKHTL